MTEESKEIETKEKKTRQKFTLDERLKRLSPERFLQALREHQSEGEVFAAERDRRKKEAEVL